MCIDDETGVPLYWSVRKLSSPNLFYDRQRKVSLSRCGICLS
jgi:hypothetical protein